MRTLLRVSVQEAVSKLASAVLSHCSKLLKEASPTYFIDKMAIKKVNHGIVQLDNSLKILNKRNLPPVTYSFIQISTSFKFVCLKVCFRERKVRELVLFTTLWLCMVRMGKVMQIHLINNAPLDVTEETEVDFVAS